MEQLERIVPPKRRGQRARPITTVSIYSDTLAALIRVVERWNTTRTDALRYLVDLARAGYIPVPAPPHPIVVDYSIEPPPDSIEAAGIDLINGLRAEQVDWREARVRIVELIRLAGCEARASWVKGEDGESESE